MNINLKNRYRVPLLLIILPLLLTTLFGSSAAQDAPFIVWVYDVNTTDSEFGYYDGVASTLVNGFHEGADIEGLACIDNIYYGSSGHNTLAPSELITIELDLANDQSICHPIAVIHSANGTPFYEVASLAVDQDGTLWGFAEDVDLTGIIRIDPVTAEAELVKPSSHKVEGLAWITDTLWLVGDNNFYTWQPGIEITPAFTLTENVEVEALDAVDGLLYAGIHKDTRGIVAIDPTTGMIVQTPVFPAPDDIEGLAFCESPNMPTPTMTPTQTMTPTMTATAPPTETPIPTSTLPPAPTSTFTPMPTATLISTATSEPTATTALTSTPPPTATLEPTATTAPTATSTSTPIPTAVDEPSDEELEDQPTQPGNSERRLFMPVILK